MNITEIKVGCKVLCEPTETERQVAYVKAINKDGKVSVRNVFGDVLELAPERIARQFETESIRRGI